MPDYVHEYDFAFTAFSNDEFARDISINDVRLAVVCSLALMSDQELLGHIRLNDTRGIYVEELAIAV